MFLLFLTVASAQSVCDQVFFDVDNPGCSPVQVYLDSTHSSVVISAPSNVSLTGTETLSLPLTETIPGKRFVTDPTALPLGPYTAQVTFLANGTFCNQTTHFAHFCDSCSNVPFHMATIDATSDCSGNTTITISIPLGSSSVYDISNFTAVSNSGIFPLPIPSLPIPSGGSSSVSTILPPGTYTISGLLTSADITVCNASTTTTVTGFSVTPIIPSFDCATSFGSGVLIIAGLTNGTVSVNGGSNIPVTGTTVVPVNVTSAVTVFSVNSSTCGIVNTTVAFTCCSLPVKIFPRGTRCNRNEGELKVFVVGAPSTHPYLFSLDGEPSRPGFSPFIFQHVSPGAHVVLVTDPSASNCTQLTFTSIHNEFDCKCVNECIKRDECNECDEF